MTEGGINPDRAGVNVLITPDVAALWSQPHAASAPLPHSNELDSEGRIRFPKNKFKYKFNINGHQPETCTGNFRS